MSNLSNKTLDIRSTRVLKSIFERINNSEYTLGAHGYDSSHIYTKTNDNEWILNQNEINYLNTLILQDGLNYKEGRTLTSTVSFDLPYYVDTTGTYTAGIIIALPKVLKSNNRPNIELGTPHEIEIEYDPSTNKYTSYDRNHNSSSLADAYLPKDNNLNPMFILGTYLKTKEGITLKINPSHILFNNGLVPNDFYDECVSRINKSPTK